jgi:hypothetical protein
VRRWQRRDPARRVKTRDSLPRHVHSLLFLCIVLVVMASTPRQSLSREGESSEYNQGKHEYATRAKKERKDSRPQHPINKAENRHERRLGAVASEREEEAGRCRHGGREGLVFVCRTKRVLARCILGKERVVEKGGRVEEKKRREGESKWSRSRVAFAFREVPSSSTSRNSNSKYIPSRKKQ